MKELKPKLTLANSRRGGDRSKLKLLMVFILGFALGIYTEMELKDINIDRVELARKDETQSLNRSTEIQSEKTYSDENSEVDNDMASKRPKANPIQDDSTISAASTSTIAIENKQNNPEIEHLAESESKQDNRVADKNNIEASNKEYTLQIAAFKTIERAEMGANELKSRGYDVYIIPVLNSKEESWNLVRMGKFSTREEAENFAATLQFREGIKAIVKELD